MVMSSIDQDVAVTQYKWHLVDDLPCQLNDATGPILDDLDGIFDLQAEARAIAKIFANGVSVITDDDQKILNPGHLQSLDDVQQNRFIAHLDHRLRQFRREFSHASPATGGKKDGL